MRVLILKATKGFQYEVVNLFSEELVNEFNLLGIESQIIEANQEEVDFLKQTISYILDGIDMVIHFNGFLFDPIPKFNIIYQLLNKLDIVIGTILVDHPFYLVSRLNNISRNNSFVCMYDQGFLFSCEKYINKDLIITQLMHGGSIAKKKQFPKGNMMF